MGIFALTSAAGSPGATTTALGMALHWPQEVLLIEADPIGGSAILAGHFRGEVAHPDTAMQLWEGSRQGQMERMLREVPLKLTERASFVPGPAGAAQAMGLRDLWPALAPQLHRLSEMGVDVIIDLGRWGHAAFALPLALCADEVVLVLRADLVSAAAVAAMNLPDGMPVSALVVGPGRPYGAKTVEQVVKIPVRAIPWAPEEAAVLSHGAAPRKRSSKKLSAALGQISNGLIWRQGVTEIHEGVPE